MKNTLAHLSLFSICISLAACSGAKEESTSGTIENRKIDSPREASGEDKKGNWTQLDAEHGWVTDDGKLYVWTAVGPLGSFVDGQRFCQSFEMEDLDRQFEARLIADQAEWDSVKKIVAGDAADFSARLNAAQGNAPTQVENDGFNFGTKISVTADQFSHLQTLSSKNEVQLKQLLQQTSSILTLNEQLSDTVTEFWIQNENLAKADKQSGAGDQAHALCVIAFDKTATERVENNNNNKKFKSAVKAQSAVRMFLANKRVANLRVVAETQASTPVGSAHPSRSASPAVGAPAAETQASTPAESAHPSRSATPVVGASEGEESEPEEGSDND